MNHARVGVGVALYKDGMLLLGKRKSGMGIGDWAFPGGHLELFESFEQCAARETHEETGLVIANITFLYATNDLFPDHNTHYITVIMQATYSSGTLILKEPDKCEGWQWFAPDQLPEPLFLPIKNLLDAQPHILSKLQTYTQPHIHL